MPRRHTNQPSELVRSRWVEARKLDRLARVGRLAPPAIAALTPPPAVAAGAYAVAAAAGTGARLDA